MTIVAEGYDVEREIENHIWANTILMQFPVNWMGVPWSFKKYMDDVYKEIPTLTKDGNLTMERSHRLYYFHLVISHALLRPRITDMARRKSGNEVARELVRE